MQFNKFGKTPTQRSHTIRHTCQIRQAHPHVLLFRLLLGLLVPREHRALQPVVVYPLPQLLFFYHQQEKSAYVTLCVCVYIFQSLKLSFFLIVESSSFHTIFAIRCRHFVCVGARVFFLQYIFVYSLDWEGKLKCPPMLQFIVFVVVVVVVVV